MEREKVMVVVVVVWMVCGPSVATINVDQTSNYCSQVQHSLNCVFTNTSEEVEVREIGRGLLSVKVEGATALRGSPPCGTTLHVLSSANVTLQGALTHASEGKASAGVRQRRSSNKASAGVRQRSSNKASAGVRQRRSSNKASAGVRQRRSSNKRLTENSDSPTRRPLQSVTVHSTTSEQTVTSSVSKTSVSVSVSTEERASRCVRNVSVVQSKLHWLRGQFDQVNIQLSEVGELVGEIGRLDVRNNSTVSKFSASGNQVLIEETRMHLLSRMEVRQQLLLRNVNIESLVSPGLVLHEPQDGGGQVHDGYARAHTLSEVKVNTMKTEAVQVMSGQVSITNMIVDEAHVAALTVKDGGVLTLKNVHIHRGPTTCLILHGEARVVLLNFTLGYDTISDLELSSKGFKKTAYPLHTLWSAGDTILPRIGPANPVSEGEDTATGEFPGFPWYWVVIMAVVGIFAGIIVGSAIMWQRPNLMKGQPSALTLSDLIGRDGLQEETESHTSNTLQHPELLRQDSGLTSSSFASFTPCQERPQTASLFPKQPQNPDCLPEPTSPEPSVYVHVAPLPCTSEEVIFEEVEALSAPKVEHTPPDEVRLTSEVGKFEKLHSMEHVC